LVKVLGREQAQVMETVLVLAMVPEPAQVPVPAVPAGRHTLW
jgi:hypothetical protein